MQSTCVPHMAGPTLTIVPFFCQVCRASLNISYLELAIIRAVSLQKMPVRYDHTEVEVLKSLEETRPMPGQS
ncbi:hypothetical protein BDP55DRAFT_362685 [Colletotrichum godetiae]|uniref:Uncharacterized protein n=1 Tax=Colletotrichum godetiae TaxID=1209918 RepID=A0AAJ0EN22_9PEZI|nr:uncharacterized protein BDP55DRAFT_362685 [Colletotrichum godetiae]KAK1659325.1 hypothetical protein BDP55DRAFT_362685 [Colletotrichum godetiae]